MNHKNRYVQVEYQFPGSVHTTTIEGYIVAVGNDYFYDTQRVVTISVMPALGYPQDTVHALDQIIIPISWVISIYPTTPTLGATDGNQRGRSSAQTD